MTQETPVKPKSRYQIMTDNCALCERDRNGEVFRGDFICYFCVPRTQRTPERHAPTGEVTPEKIR